ncbi:hypothetical protein MTO96_051027 [Rhipicephalus appendiculatus]
MCDFRDSTSNDSFFHPSSSEHLPMGGGYEEDKTVSRLGDMSPLSSVSFDEKNSDGTSEPTATYQTTQQEQLSSSEEVSSRKRSMTLDLHSPGASQRSSKQARCSSLLTSPDLQMLALSTPELEGLIITLNGRDPTVSRLFVLSVSEEEEQCPSDFPESLDQLQLPLSPPMLQQNATSGTDVSDSCDSTSDDSFSRHLSSEPQTMPRLSSTPPQLPIDMCDRYRLMLEQKRESNRIAANKSRQRKLDRISELEEKVYALKMEKTVLEYNTSILRHEVYQLSQVVMTHIREGCIDVMLSHAP